MNTCILLALSDTHLSEDVACQRLIQPWLHVNEFKQVQSISVLLHHQLEVAAVFKHLQHLMEYGVCHMQHHALATRCLKGSISTDLDDVVVLYSCENGNLLANASQHGVVNPGLTHYPGLVNELHHHLKIFMSNISPDSTHT